MTKPFNLLLALLMACLAGFASAEGEITWSGKLDRADVRAGELARVVVTAKIKDGWHTYSIVPVADGPFPTTVQPAAGDGVSRSERRKPSMPVLPFETR